MMLDALKLGGLNLTWDREYFEQQGDIDYQTKVLRYLLLFAFVHESVSAPQ